MESIGRGRPDGARQRRMVQRSLAPDFFDSSLEWRRVSRDLGTFLLVLVAAGGGVVAAMSGAGSAWAWRWWRQESW